MSLCYVVIHIMFTYFKRCALKLQCKQYCNSIYAYYFLDLSLWFVGFVKCLSSLDRVLSPRFDTLDQSVYLEWIFQILPRQTSSNFHKQNTESEAIE